MPRSSHRPSSFSWCPAKQYVKFCPDHLKMSANDNSLYAGFVLRELEGEAILRSHFDEPILYEGYATVIHCRYLASQSHA